MNSIRSRSRLAGALYAVMGAFGFVSIMYIPGKLVVRNDAAATAANIMNSESLYRFGILSQMISQILFIWLALLFLDLFRNVDRRQAALLVALVCASVAIEFANTLNLFVPLILLGNAPYLSSFTRPQLESLAYASIRLRDMGINNVSSFWGLWLLPLGVLVIRSNWFPKIIGWLLIVSCIAYVTGAFIHVMYPDQMHAASMYTLTFGGLGEFAVMLWLMFVGARVPPAGEAEYASAA